MLPNIKHEFISAYLRYVEDTESPRLFHIWAALAGVSAALGRRCWYPRAMKPIYPNLFTVFVGSPATKKSTAINIMVDLLEDVTNVRFAPDDTGGQRQGLIDAMAKAQTTVDEEQELLEALGASQPDRPFNLSDLTGDNLRKLDDIHLDCRDPYSMFAVASELNSFIGENNTAMMTFLQRMFDGDKYTYKLKATEHTIKGAILNILGGTTPGQIALAIPQAAIGQGFTSRVIFVHGDQVHKRVPRPSLDQALIPYLKLTYKTAFFDLNGAFEETKGAADAFDRIYLEGVAIKDPRFTHYCERRNGELLQKVAMALTASRGSLSIQAHDVTIANQLLMMTEDLMPLALGEYGMNTLGVAKQRLLDYITGATGAVPTQLLYSLMSRDMKQLDFYNAILELHNAGKISKVMLPDLGEAVVAISMSAAKRARTDMQELAFLLQESTRG